MRCNFLILAAAAALIALAGSCSRAVGEAAAHNESGSPWIADPADSVCGLPDPRMLSNPARIDYVSVLAATPEMRRIQQEGIDPASPRGVVLRQQAVDRLFHAAEFVRSREGYCSVWKRIAHRDGRSIPDVSAAVRARFPASQPLPDGEVSAR
ncbi:MAG: hypothetical protein JNK02_14660 [Planctomycetes bacterium]|nr:hypothetical protein [Planctomycetota bacterium]